MESQMKIPVKYGDNVKVILHIDVGANVIFLFM